MLSRVAAIRWTAVGIALATTKLSVEEIVTTNSNGRDQMPAFGRAYKPEELQDVATYVRDELAAH